MHYFVTFLEGVITFVSPCLLPMIPIYISFFAGGTSVITESEKATCSAGKRGTSAVTESEKAACSTGERGTSAVTESEKATCSAGERGTSAVTESEKTAYSSEESSAIGEDKKTIKNHTLRNAFAFVCGFTVVFVSLGMFAGTLGRLLSEHQTVVNIVSGLIVALFGLNYVGIMKIPFLNKTLKINMETKDMGIVSSFLFGLIFSIGWTPCVGAFLGSALMLASQQGSAIKGVLMLLTYSAGLAIPFIASAVLIGKLKTAFDFIKRHYRIVNIVSGLFLVAVGIAMMLGLMNRLLSMLTFSL